MGIRVVKTAIATVVAVYLAVLMELDYPMSAGLLAILGVETTIRKGLASSFARLAASVLGLLSAALITQLFGFQPWVLAVYILTMFPILARARLQNGIATCSVTVFHVFSQGTVSSAILLNEFTLLLVGLGTATIVNVIYMPDAEEGLRKTRSRLEELFSSIFLQISRHLRDPSYVWDGHEVLEAHETIRQGAALAQKEAENRLFQGNSYWITYFEMREQQLDIIEDMIGLVSQVYETLPLGHTTAELFEELSEDVKVEHYAGNVERRLLDLERQFKSMPLPASREEFEVRSAILQLCRALNQYLSIAKRHKRPKAIVQS